MMRAINGALTKLLAHKITFSRIQRILNNVAIPLLLNLPQQLKLINTTRPAKFRPLFEINKIFFYKHLSVYISKKFDTRKRVDIINSHYAFVSKNLADDFIERIVKGSIEIWQLEALDDVYTIELAYPANINSVYQYDNEGEISLRIKFNGEVVHTSGFTISKIDNKRYKNPLKNAILVGRIQGAKNNQDLLRRATKALHEISPATLALCAFKGIADCLQIDSVLGVSNEVRVVDKNEVFFNYDKHWIDAGAVPSDDGLFLLPVNQEDKPIELIAQKHRSRTLKKRAFKKKIREGVSDGFRERCVRKQLTGVMQC